MASEIFAIEKKLKMEIVELTNSHFFFSSITEYDLTLRENNIFSDAAHTETLNHDFLNRCIL